MMRAMCGVEMIDKRSSQEIMGLLGSNFLKDTLDGLARVSGVQWYGYCFEKG